MKKHPEITYIKTHDAEPFDYKPFPISKFPECQPHKGTFAEGFIAIIPNGQVFSENGYVKVGNDIVLECMHTNNYSLQISDMNKQSHILNHTPKTIKGKVVVLAQEMSWIYFHWMAQTLERLRLIQELAIPYNYLYVCFDKPFMTQTLSIFDIDSAKIINSKEFNYIQAEELIILSFPCRKILQKNKLATNNPNLASFCSQQTMKHLCAKILPLTKNISHDFSKKVFISRNDSGNRRTTTNEDDVFALFEKKGFARYCLTNLSIIEQAALFNQAEVIVATHGAALMNLAFCKPKTKIIEIFQARSSSTYWYMSQQLNLDYHYIQTRQFNKIEIFGRKNLDIPLDKIQNFLNRNII